MTECRSVGPTIMVQAHLSISLKQMRKGKGKAATPFPLDPNHAKLSQFSKRRKREILIL